jgi:serine/threonine protein kinase
MAGAKTYGKWQTIGSLGEGGQARVFKVRDTTGAASEICVLKRLKNIESPERRKRFAQEVEALKKISHPNILRVLEHDLESNKPYYVAECCEQGSLERIGAGRFKANVHESMAIVLPITDALVAAHNAGVIHRDVKPPNVLLRSDGTPVLGDFGICYVDDGVCVTLSDEDVGSINYIAPEMESGAHALGPPSERTDAYSLSKVVYWMLSGGRAFAREDHRGNNSLVNLLADQRFEHMHMLLDRVLVRDPRQRVSMHELKEEFQMAAALVEGNYAPLAPSIGIRCRFCGIGSYERAGVYGKDNGYRHFGLGNNRRAYDPGGKTALLRCGHCGHIEWFQLLGIKCEGWWDR